MSTQLAAVINPKSGKGNHGLTSNYLNKQLKGKVLEMTGQDDRKQIREFLDRHQPETLIVGGGDGTLKSIAEVIHDQGINLAPLPLGSANGLCKEFNMIADPLAIIDNYLQNKYLIYSLDAIDINGEICLHMADLGLNASIVRSFEDQNVRGFLGYAMSMVSEINDQLIANNELIFEIGIDQRSIATTMFLIANCKKYGTGVTVNPTGDPSDGKFEAGSLQSISPESIKDFLFTFTETQATSNSIPSIFDLKAFKELSISCNKEVNFQVDGEYIGMTNQIDAKIIHEYINLAIPAISGFDG